MPDPAPPTQETPRLAHRLYPDLHHLVDYIAAAKRLDTRAGMNRSAWRTVR
ncbi:hypothetical protein ACQP1G_08985 [Nocardia sp. CA-107356]|uniref:hypothetical protein n=1 Tax=Nocardia sp. CA-107356 TaxID=3239972 RepID=UPI003D8CC5A9